MLSRRKEKKIYVLFVVSRNTGLDLGLSINLYETQNSERDKVFGFQFYQTLIKRFFCPLSNANLYFKINC